ncbi:uncharacterized protein LY89DRAFT_627027 [Mollisia scopiformis]|uniref:Uncharacterized protein n=1 Tax=Mollisia scopiformis TaxID=149040 RepID=A0A132BDL3_MOLSC|nr:uncharacterized protein LY89DRAFT_627027 [Mollisia scopiformis]KUJ10486.1 hypothetical protein LY89DRAFT_627027 [Mollisia scopiformis]
MSTNQARTNLGPLTTTATLPSSCQVPVEQCSTCSEAWGAQTCFASTIDSTVDYGVQDNTDCWPSTTSFVATPPIPLQGWGFYSPGLVCPSGMYSACSATASRSSGWPVQFGLLSGETAVGCCPSGYTCANGYAQTCLTTASQTSFQVVSCQSGSTGLFTYLTLPQTLTSTVGSSASVFLQDQYVLSAPLIQINWQSSDRISSTTSGFGSSSPTSTSSSPASQTSSSISTQTSTPSSGLSTGAKAGLGVGIAAVVLAFVALAFFIYRKRKNAYAQTGQDSPPTTQPLYEMNGGKKDYYSGQAELPSERSVWELPPKDNKPQPQQVHEMYA